MPTLYVAGTHDAGAPLAAMRQAEARVDDGQAGHHRRMAGAHRGHHGRDDLDRHQWPGGIVDERTSTSTQQSALLGYSVAAIADLPSRQCRRNA